MIVSRRLFFSACFRIRILENLMTEIASATYMLQQCLELFSYSGIAQKAAFWLLTRARQTGKNQVQIKWLKIMVLFTYQLVLKEW